MFPSVSQEASQQSVMLPFKKLITTITISLHVIRKRGTSDGLQNFASVESSLVFLQKATRGRLKSRTITQRLITA